MPVDDAIFKTQLHFKPQMHWICRPAAFNFIGRYERLKEDFAEMCRRLGRKLPALPHIYKGDHRPWEQYYTTQELIEKVAQIYARDIRRLGYSVPKVIR